MICISDHRQLVSGQKSLCSMTLLWRILAPWMYPLGFGCRQESVTLHGPPPRWHAPVCLIPEENLPAQTSPVCIPIKHCRPFFPVRCIYFLPVICSCSHQLSDVCQISVVPSLMLNLSLLFASFIIYLHLGKRENDIRVCVSNKLYQPNLQRLNNSTPRHRGKKNRKIYRGFFICYYIYLK